MERAYQPNPISKAHGSSKTCPCKPHTLFQVECTDPCTPTKFETLNLRSLFHSKNATKDKHPNEPSVTVALQEWHHLKRKKCKQKTVRKSKKVE